MWLRRLRVRAVRADGPRTRIHLQWSISMLFKLQVQGCSRQHCTCANPGILASEGVQGHSASFKDSVGLEPLWKLWNHSSWRTDGSPCKHSLPNRSLCACVCAWVHVCQRHNFQLLPGDVNLGQGALLGEWNSGEMTFLRPQLGVLVRCTACLTPWPCVSVAETASSIKPSLLDQRFLFLTAQLIPNTHFTKHSPSPTLLLCGSYSLNTSPK